MSVFDYFVGLAVKATTHLKPIFQSYRNQLPALQINWSNWFLFDENFGLIWFNSTKIKVNKFLNGDGDNFFL